MALSVLLPLLSIGVLVAWWRSALPRRTWLIVIVAQLLLVGSGFIALRTGESEEEKVEDYTGESAIKEHEEAAEVFVWAGAGVLAISILALLLKNERRGQLAAALAAAGTLGVLGLGYRVGHLGGELVYRDGAASAYASPNAGGGEAGEGHDDDDDDD